MCTASGSLTKLFGFTVKAISVLESSLEEDSAGLCMERGDYRRQYRIRCFVRVMRCWCKPRKDDSTGHSCFRQKDRQPQAQYEREAQ